MAFQSFNVTSVDPSSSSASFDHGVEYPAVIAGLWNASNEWQGKVKHGVVVLVLVEDNSRKLVYRSFFMSLDGYVIGKQACYCRIMQGLLRCSDTDGALKDKINQAGLSDLTQIVGRPCLARMVLKEKDGKTWSSIETLQGETPRFKGLEIPSVESIEPVDIEKCAGKFVNITSIDDCITIPTLRVLGRAHNPIMKSIAEINAERNDTVPQVAVNREAIEENFTIEV